MKKSPAVTESGFALITVLLLLAVLTSLLGAHLAISHIELATLRASKNSVTGFYAAEAGLNIRAESIRNIFIGYNTPQGITPTLTTPCVGGNNGSGDMACQQYSFSNRNVTSYVIDHQAGTIPDTIPIPQGELYQGLIATEYRFTTHSEAKNQDGTTEAILELRFKNRLVPMFQFAVFYDKDLEIQPGAPMLLSGPVHTNGDLYMNSGASLQVDGQVTTAGTLYRGRKDSTACNNSSTAIKDPSNFRQLIATCPARIAARTADITPFNGMVKFKVDPVSVPGPEQMDPAPGALYWDKADLRVVLRLNSAGYPDTSSTSSGLEIRNASNGVDTTATARLNNCAGRIKRNPVPQPGNSVDNNLRAIGSSFAYKNIRENKVIRMMDIDLGGLLTCLQTDGFLGLGRTLDDSTENGLVFYFTVAGPQSLLAANNYGVRVSNGAKIGVAGAPTVRGLTIVSDQAVYVQGNYNTISKKPAAILSDSLNVLSEAWWTGSGFNDAATNTALNTRIPTNTTQNFAVLSGTDTTGGPGGEGTPGQGGAYNGGLENYPRFEEDWGGVTYAYRGSLVSLGRPRHVNGYWPNTGIVYNAPNRDWNYDVSFNNAANLPPLTPRFVYLKQELFVRDFEQ